MSASLFDPRTGLEYELADGVNALGRREENDICLPGSAVSRFHAEIRLEAPGWVIEDHGSTYGTYVNGEIVSGSRPLCDGDSVRIGVTTQSPEGEYDLVFRLGGAGAEGSPVAARRARAPSSRRVIQDGQAEIEAVGGALVARMSGIFRKGEIDSLATELRRRLAESPRVAALDLRDVTYMNSYALSVLVDLAAAHRDRGVALRAFGAEGAVRKLLELPGEASPVELCASEEEALGRD